MRECACWIGLLVGLGVIQAQPIELPRSEFTHPGSVTGWVAQHDVTPVEPTREGLQVRILGNDPYFVGPAWDYPSDLPLWARLRVW